MSLRFRYELVRMGRPLVPLRGRSVRPRPLIPVTISGPAASSLERAVLDTGADDTVFPERLAVALGLDLGNAPTGRAAAVRMGTVPLRYAEVSLSVDDGQEQREWTAWVGFTSAPLRHPLLGFAGFLQFFDALFLGAQEVVELTANSLYTGT
jgi:hypothetical protein